jgi:hypothetical protein
MNKANQIVSRNAMLAWAFGLVGCLGAMGSAQALSPAQVDSERYAGYLKEIRLAGADGPTMRALLGKYVEELAEPGSLDVFSNDKTGASYRAYSFRLKATVGIWPAGTAVLVTKRSAGGARDSVRAMATVDATQQHMRVDARTSNCVAAPDGVSPATSSDRPGFYCVATIGGYADASFSEFEPAMYSEGVNGGGGWSLQDLESHEFAQGIFGVAVNKKLYLALQKTQGLVDMAAFVVDESPAKQPMLPVPFVRGALTGQLLGNDPSTKKGWNLVVSAQADAEVMSKKINVCRSGTGGAEQIALNAYFANNPCGGGDLYVASNTGGTIGANGSLAVISYGSGGERIGSCLGGGVNNAAGIAYGLGVLALEHNPFEQMDGGVVVDKGYRFVKLNGAAPSRADAINGSYEFVYGSTLTWAKTRANAPTSDKLEFLMDMRDKLVTTYTLAAIAPDRDGMLVSPHGYVGAWDNLWPKAKEFASHSRRKASASCSLVRMEK